MMTKKSRPTKYYDGSEGAMFVTHAAPGKTSLIILIRFLLVHNYSGQTEYSRNDAAPSAVDRKRLRGAHVCDPGPVKTVNLMMWGFKHTSGTFMTFRK